LKSGMRIAIPRDEIVDIGPLTSVTLTVRGCASVVTG
jgi:hypothetical protein